MGFPEDASSEYIESSSSGLVISLSRGSPRVKFSLFLKTRNLPEGAVLEIHFQNSFDPSKAFVVVVADTSDSDIYVESPNMVALKCQNYWIDVHIYPDMTSVQEIGTHVQWVNSSFC